MALSLMQPKLVTPQQLNNCGIGELVNMDYSKLHVAIAACIDGGPVSQEEQRTMATMVDEVVFDLRRRGPSWTQNVAVLIVRFPDVESFVQSLNGERNLVRAAETFHTRQYDKCMVPGEGAVRLGLAWQVPTHLHPQTAKGTSMLRVAWQEALVVQDDPDPALLLKMSETGDTVGVERMLNAKCSVEAARSDSGLNCLHACAVGGFADTLEILLQGGCSPQYMDSLMFPGGVAREAEGERNDNTGKACCGIQ